MENIEAQTQRAGVEETTEESTKSSDKRENVQSLSFPTSQKLTNNIVKHHLEIQLLEVKLKEILDVQKEFIDSVSKENGRFENGRQTFSIIPMFQQVSLYTKKLVHIRNEMVMIQERVARLKQRATFIKEHQERKVREMKDAKALQEERERLLTAKPVWEVETPNPNDKT